MRSPRCTNYTPSSRHDRMELQEHGGLNGPLQPMSRSPETLMTVIRPPTSIVFHMNGLSAIHTLSRTGSRMFPCGLVKVTRGATPWTIAASFVDATWHLDRLHTPVDLLPMCAVPHAQAQHIVANASPVASAAWFKPAVACCSSDAASYMLAPSKAAMSLWWASTA